jgi:hypothetical protein
LADLLSDADDALAAEYKALRPGHPAWDALHATALRAARVSSFRVCAKTGNPWQADSIVQACNGRDVVCVETCGGGKSKVILTIAMVVGGVHIVVQGLTALEGEFMQTAAEMGIEAVRVRGNAHAGDGDPDPEVDEEVDPAADGAAAAAALAADVSVYDRMLRHKRGDPALLVLVQVCCTSHSHSHLDTSSLRSAHTSHAFFVCIPHC